MFHVFPFGNFVRRRGLASGGESETHGSRMRNRVRPTPERKPRVPGSPRSRVRDCGVGERPEPSARSHR
jgi:hypothetical protein